MIRQAFLGVSCLALAGVLLVGCGSPPPPDVDNAQNKALRISSGILVKDSLNAGRNDAVDWKEFSYFDDARVSLIIAVGELGKPHGVFGDIQLLGADGALLEKQPVMSVKRDYTFNFEVKKDQKYFLKLTATKGAAAYQIETIVKVIDPCELCKPNEVCKEKKCVDPTVCVPECDSNEVCRDNVCVDACGGCPRGKRCDARSGRCLTVGGGSGGGTVTPGKKGCDPKCEDGETCNEKTGECVAAATTISATVLSVTADGTGSVILMNVGSEQGVKRGASGSIGGGKFRFKVSQVTATRSRAKVSAPPADIKGMTRATIVK